MEKKILYDKKTIIIFIIVTFVVLGISEFATNFKENSGYLGIPFIFITWDGTPPAKYTSTFNLVGLILDLVIYYITAVFIYIGLYKFKKDNPVITQKPIITDNIQNIP